MDMAWTGVPLSPSSTNRSAYGTHPDAIRAAKSSGAGQASPSLPVIKKMDCLRCPRHRQSKNIAIKPLPYELVAAIFERYHSLGRSYLYAIPGLQIMEFHMN